MLITLALSTGLRRGELLGLEWRDLDFEKNTLEVRQSSQYLPGTGLITKDPKNETSKRLISVPESVVALLKQYKAYQSEEQLKIADLWQGSNRVFTTWDGKPMHPDTVSGWFPEFLNRHGLPRIRLHDLRHTSATLLIGQGLHAKTISSRLGHANISTTMDIYGHALKSADKEAAEKLDRLFEWNENKVKG
jgi:integrase